LKKLKVGIIGVGIQGENHLKAYLSHPLVDVVSVADISPRKLSYVKEKYGVKGLYSDFNEMLEKEDLDLVSVATPDFLHRDPVINSLESGVNVVVEKPMATTVKDAEDMVSAARRTGVVLYPNFGNRWNPAFASVRERIADGETGRPVYGYFRLSDTIYVPTKMLSWAGKSNVVFFLMSHTADLARWIFQDEVSSVQAFAEQNILRSLGIDTYDYVVAILRFKQGGMVVLESSWILPEGLPSIVDFRAEIICEKGVYYVDQLGQTVSVADMGRMTYPRFLGAYKVNNRFYGFVRESLHHLVDCLLNEEKPMISPEDGLANTKVLIAILESVKNIGRRISI